MAKSSEYDFLYNLERIDFCAEGLHYIPRIQYGREHPRQYMECIYEDGYDEYPVLIWIHGGGWQDENLTSTYRPERVLAQLAKKGWFIACIEYRLARHGAFPVMIRDCQKAIIFLKEHCRSFHVNPDRIAVWGESAGAHLACMAGAQYNDEPGTEVQAIVSWYGPSDMTETYQSSFGSANEEVFKMLLGRENPEEQAKSVSPIFYAGKKMPPVLLMHGDMDTIVDYGQSVRYYERLKNAGNDVEFITVSGQGHGFFKGQKYYDMVVSFLEDKVRKQ